MAYAQIDEYYIPFLRLLGRNELVVFVALLRRRNRTTKKCNPKLATIAKETNLPAPRVTEAVRGLENKNWIVWSENGEFFFPEKITESVTPKVTEFVRKSYGIRKKKAVKKLRNSEVGVTDSVTRLNKDKEHLIEHIAETASLREKKPRPAQEESLVRQAQKFLEDVWGKYPDFAAQGKAAKWMLANGATLEQIKSEVVKHIAETPKEFCKGYLTLQKLIFKKDVKPKPVGEFINGVPGYTPEMRQKLKESQDGYYASRRPDNGVTAN